MGPLGRALAAALLLAAPCPAPGGEAAALRIASLSPGATEILFALEAGGLVAAVSRHCDHPVEARLKPKAGDFNRPDLEALTALGPDLVVLSEYGRPGDEEALEEAGLRALVLPARNVAEVGEAIRRLGRLTQREERAEELVAEIEAALVEVGARLAGLPEVDRPRVYLEVDGPARLYAVGPGSFMDDLIRAAGGRNAFGDRRVPYFAVDPGEVAAAEPDVILIDHPFQYKGGVAKRPGWSGLSAVRNARVYDRTDFDIVLVNRPGPRIGEAVRVLSRLLHPEVCHADR
ncbi:MAG: ABC transporter substrate-binding protein [Thermodesulfobacteriota bacterium]